MKPALFVLLGVIAVAFAPAHKAFCGEVVVGDSRDYVIQQMGYANSRTLLGSTEILTYNSGLTVTLEKGVVVEMARKGEVKGLKNVYYSTRRTEELRSTRAPGSVLAKTDSSTSRPNPARATQPNRETSPADPPIPVLESDRLPASTEQPDPGELTPAPPPPFNIQQPPPGPMSLDAAVVLARVRAMLAGVLLAVLFVGLLFYAFYSYCLKRICEKAGEEPGIMIWIPILQLVPMLRVAQLPVFLILLFLVPGVNCVFGIVLWAKTCSALGKSPWLVLLIFVPGLNLLFLPYLAFSGGNEMEEVPPLPSDPCLPPPVPKDNLAPAAG